MLLSALIYKYGKGFLIKIIKFIDIYSLFLFDFIASFFVKSNSVAIIWGWAAYYTIKSANRKKTLTILQQSSSANLHQNQILKEEYIKLGLELDEINPQIIINRQKKEAEIADYILCPSIYVANTFINVYNIPKTKILIQPYAVDTNLFKMNKRKTDDVFRIIYVGNIGVAKGIHYLIDALELLQKNNVPYECLLIGKIKDNYMNYFNKKRHLFKYLGKVPHNELNDYYNSSSVFVFPTLDDGFGLVLFEAMASGLPVIATTNCGASTIIKDGEEGFIVPIRDSNAIFEKLVYLFNNRSVLENMSNKAFIKSKNYDWDEYTSQLLNSIDKLLLNAE
jgi:glycosyltransferase involved in cell wall biosynthesis